MRIWCLKYLKKNIPSFYNASLVSVLVLKHHSILLHASLVSEVFFKT